MKYVIYSNQYLFLTGEDDPDRGTSPDLQQLNVVRVFEADSWQDASKVYTHYILTRSFPKNKEEFKKITDMKAAVCILVLNSEGLVLGVSRKHDPNDFGLPGGKVDPGETEEQAVIREMKEETGLDISNIKNIFQHTAEREYWTSCWTGDITGTIHTKEVGVVKWVEPDVLLQGCFGQYNKILFDDFACYYCEGSGRHRKIAGDLMSPFINCILCKGSGILLKDDDV